MNISTSLINNALGRMEQVSAHMAVAPVTNDLPENMVDMSKAAHEVKLGAATVRTQDQMLGSLIDMMA